MAALHRARPIQQGLRDSNPARGRLGQPLARQRTILRQARSAFEVEQPYAVKPSRISMVPGLFVPRARRPIVRRNAQSLSIQVAEQIHAISVAFLCTLQIQGLRLGIVTALEGRVAAREVFVAGTRLFVFRRPPNGWRLRYGWSLRTGLAGRRGGVLF